MVDASVLAALERLAFDLVGDVILPFRVQTAARLAALDEAVARGDCDAARKIAHSLKGESVVVGAREMASACARLERLARQGEAAETVTALRALHDADRRLVAAFEVLSQRP